MNFRPLSLASLLFALTAGDALAYPPIPYHRVYGTIRDDLGNPLQGNDAIAILYGADNKEIVRGPTDPNLGGGINYNLAVPMDAALIVRTTDARALQLAWPFTIRVIQGSKSYLPIQMQGASWTIGQPAQSTRIDLTLGIDSDGDGLPDAWELDLIRSDPSQRFQNISQVRPQDDADGDGLSNATEYIAGTYAMDAADGLFLKIEEVTNGIARMEFLAISRRTYQISHSKDLKGFAAKSFSFQADASNPALSYRAEDTEFLTIYVNVGTEKSNFFKLGVE